MKFAGEQSCHKYCENSCRTPRDGVCQDHWPCRLGSDCADCGVRVMCKPRGTSLLLPRAILSPAGAPPLTVDKVLFVVFGSARLRAKSERAHETWCSVHGATGFSQLPLLQSFGSWQRMPFWQTPQNGPPQSTSASLWLKMPSRQVASGRV